MKKFYLTLVVMCFIALSVSSQSAFEKGDMAAGGSFVIGGDETTLVGIAFKFQYNVTDPIRLEGSLMVFPEQDHLSMTDFSVFVHYLFPINEKVTLYPLAGLGSMTIKANYGSFLGVDLSESESDFNLRLGGGIDFALSENWFFNGELKAHFVDGGYVKMLSAGVTYKF